MHHHKNNLSFFFKLNCKRINHKAVQSTILRSTCLIGFTGDLSTFGAVTITRPSNNSVKQRQPAVQDIEAALCPWCGQSPPMYCASLLPSLHLSSPTPPSPPESRSNHPEINNPLVAVYSCTYLLCCLFAPPTTPLLNLSSHPGRTL